MNWHKDGQESFAILSPVLPLIIMSPSIRSFEIMQTLHCVFTHGWARNLYFVSTYAAMDHSRFLKVSLITEIAIHITQAFKDEGGRYEETSEQQWPRIITSNRATATNFIQPASNATEPTSRCCKCSGWSCTSSYYQVNTTPLAVPICCQHIAQPVVNVKILRRKPAGSNSMTNGTRVTRSSDGSWWTVDFAKASSVGMYLQALTSPLMELAPER